MFSFLKKKRAAADPGRARELYAAVRSALGDDDDVHVRIVASTAALLVCIAYADCDYSSEEEAVVRSTLARVQGLDAAGIAAIAEVLRAHTVAIASAEATTYARELVLLTEPDFRAQLLDVLVDLAGADGVLTVSETNALRTTTRALGLPQEIYTASQARHRDKLAVLKR